MSVTATCTTEEKVPVTVSPVTASGKPATIDGALRISVVSGTGSFELDADPLKFFMVSGDAPGVTEYLVEADADLETGEDHVSLIQDTASLTVSGVFAASFGMTAGAPVPK